MMNTTNRPTRDAVLYNYRNQTLVWADTLADGSEARVYQSDQRGGVHFLIAFARKAAKPALHFSYRGDVGQTRAIERGQGFLSGCRQHAEQRASAKAERVAFVTSLDAGSILSCSWGYEQTNVDYYQVVDVSASRKSVTLRKIASACTETGWLRGTCTAVKDAFVGEPFTRKVGLREAVTITSYATAFPWDGRPIYWSAYA
jgi:hypothetical protein